ncbi:alpha/beta hydrolase [Reichenbachiella carrageenanivorans]|uniref:Alpha/beta hydrolase n=1 Tax=Reichenbachiella carrageenanivorans TaxID=2979869 RepID=A0ABY6CW72_9BACT|nr:alpha/beta hydrolase [Reichenbachiella carrageenanivorans]UXX78166.1 alpha/beta hydrolase [Reichenbachiella carrageenanivorans]
MNGSLVWIGVGVALSLLLLFNLCFTFLYERLLFQGDSLPDDYSFNFDFEYQEIRLQPAPNVQLHGLLLQAKQAKGVILYFHGNRGNLTRWGQIADEIRKTYTYDVLVMDYRGYGKSIGTRSEAMLYQDVLTTYDYAHDELGYDQVVIHGRSIGTTMATYLAAHRPAKQLILETPMTRLRAVIPLLNSLLIYKPSLKYELDSKARINQIKCPILIFHGTKDRVVSYELGLELYNEINSESKKIITISGGKHNNLDSFEIYQLAMRRILN